MNLEKNAINDRIKAIMKDNKSINDKLKYTSPESEKKALTDKKSKNNNELRKERTILSISSGANIICLFFIFISRDLNRLIAISTL